LLFMSAGAGIVSIYAVAPFVLSLRPTMGGLLIPIIIAVVIVISFGVKIVTVLRRTSPFGGDSVDLLVMPVIGHGGLEEATRADTLTIANPTSERSALTRERTISVWPDAASAYADPSPEGVLS
jgi:hypothetical protein